MARVLATWLVNDLCKVIHEKQKAVVPKDATGFQENQQVGWMRRDGEAKKTML